MADDLWGALGYSAPQKKTADVRLPSDPNDLAVRIAMLEEKDPEARKWVAGVIANRAKKKGDLKGALTEPNAFEPLTSKKAELAAIDPNSEEYKQAAAQLLPIIQGKAADPSGGATNFYAPDAQAELAKTDGRPLKPDFDNGQGVKIGQSLFFGGSGEAPKAGGLWDTLGYTPGPAKPDEGPEFDAEHPKMIKYAELKPADQKTYQILFQGGALDPNAPQGSQHFPFFNTDPKQVPPGAYYVEDGNVKRAPGGPKESSVSAGGKQGVADVATSITHLIPGSDDSDIKNTLLANQMLYGAKYGGDTASGAGRFAGQLIGSAPLLAGGEAALAPALARLSPELATFLAGRAGAWKGADLGNRLLRVGSLATQGGITGAGATGLSSSANPEPLPEQLGAGFAGGALVGPAAPALRSAGQGFGRLVSSLAEPLTGTGQEKIVTRLLGDVSGGYPVRPDLTPIVAGSEPTLAESAGNAGLSALERNVRTNPRVGQRFAERQAQNSLARTNLFNSVAGDENSLARLEDAREAATAGAREAALKSQTQPADVTPVLAKIDSLLKGPEGKQKEVRTVLNDVRENLHNADGNAETDAAMLYGVRKDINDLLSGKASKERGSAQLAASELKAVKDELDNAIQKVAPGFKEYLKTYSDMSKPIDEQRFLQGLKIADVNGNITLSRVNSALDKIDTLRKKPGANEAKSISDATLKALRDVQADLKRAGNIDLGKARGSDTGQNLVTEGIAKAAGVPSDLAAAFGIHPKAAVVMGLGKLLYGSKNPQVLERLATRLLEPGVAPVPAPVLQSKITGPVGKTIKTLRPKVSAVSGLAANRLLAPQ